MNIKTRHAVRRIAAVLSFVTLLSGCVTRPRPECPGLAAVLEAEDPVYLDQFRVSLPFSLSVRNPGTGPARIESFEAKLVVEGAATEVETGQAGDMVIAGGKTQCVAFSAPVDMRRLGTSGAAAASPGPREAPSAVAWALEGLARVRLADGSAEEIRVSSKGSFVPVREPEFRIVSIRIERDLLVTTNLKLELEIDNPNAFPVRLEVLDWKLAGEGRFWAGGRSADALDVAAGSSAKRDIAFEMNFSDMDRRLFDLVAKLRVVRYGFSGKAAIASGLVGMPPFETVFDVQGSCAVER